MPSLDPTEPSAPESGRAEPSVNAPGDRIGRYLVIEEIGRGGMGVVYAAYDPELDRKVAIKVLHPTQPGSTRPMEQALGKVMNALFGDAPAAAPEPAALGRDDQRLLREAQAAARINHPSVVTVHDVGQHAGRVFVAMEFVRGQTLRQWSAHARRSWREVVEVMVQAAAGLAAAHASGLVHRDFKPDNVMIGDDGRVRVMDFGLVRHGLGSVTDDSADALRPTTDALSLELTRGGAAMGTPAYMAPEQHAGLPLDGRADQFSFCVTLWEALYGARPFAGGTVASLATAVLEGRRTPPPADREVPRAIHRIVATGLAADPTARWPSMDALVAALRSDPVRRRNRRVAVAATVAVLVAGAVGWQIERQRELAGCDDAANAAAAVWSDDVHDAVTSRIEGTGTAYAGAAVATITASIDTFVTTWAGLTRSACLTALEPDHERSSAVLECLDDRRAELEGIVAALSTVDRETVRYAVALVSPLATVGDCDDDAALAQRALRPEANAPQAVADTRASLREARLMLALRRFDAADAALAPILAASPAPIGDDAADPWHAEAKLVQGHIAERRGDYPAAQALLVDAAFEATAAGDDGTAVAAATELVWVVGYRQGRADEAEHWIRWARGLVVRMQLEQALAGAALDERTGMVESSRQRHAEAATYLEHAVAIKRARLGADSPEVALALNSLGTVLLHRDGVEAAAQTWQAALGILEAALGDAHPDLGVVLSNLAQIEFRRGDYAAARRMMERTIAIQIADRGERHPDIARSLANLGTVMNMSRDFEAARDAVRRARDILVDVHGPEHRAVASTNATLGKIELRLGNDAVGVELIERALAVQTRVLSPDDTDLAVTHSALGDALRERGDLAGAQRAYESALAICLRHGPTGHPVFTPLARFQVANVLRLRGRVAEAIPLLERAVADFAAMPSAPEESATAQLSLAMALSEVPARRSEVAPLLAAARVTFVERGDTERLAEIDAFAASVRG